MFYAFEEKKTGDGVAIMQYRLTVFTYQEYIP